MLRARMVNGQQVISKRKPLPVVRDKITWLSCLKLIERYNTYLPCFCIHNSGNFKARKCNCLKVVALLYKESISQSRSYRVPLSKM